MNSAANAEILVIDDDTVHAQSIVALLDAHELSASAMTESRAGLAQIRQQPPDVLILDLNMPEVTGLDILGEIQSLDLPTQTIVLSGESSASAVGPVVGLGAHEYLAKPHDPSTLINSVRKAVDISVLRKQKVHFEEAAQSSNRLHKFLVDASPDLIYMLDVDGTISIINNQLSDIFGFDPRTFIGRPWADLFLESQSADLARQFQNRFNERRTDARSTQQYEFDFIDQHGDRFRLEFSATGLYDNKGYSGTYGVIRDVTAKRHAEQDRLALQAKMQQASKMEAVGQLAGGIAHDFNNILASIIGFAELVLNSRAKLKDAQIEQYLTEVVHAGHRAQDLISQMLTFTRANRGEPRPISVVSAIEDVSRMLRAAIPTTIDITSDYQEALPNVLADPIQLQQVILNLLINARDAIEGNGRIDLTVRIDAQEAACITCGQRLAEPHIVMSVTDSGHGIDADLFDKIFEMYFTTRAPGMGSGIGLWLINDLIHDYHGHITVESVPGQGASFRIHLPTVVAEDVVTVAARPPLAALSGRIVVVDDEISLSNFVGEVLRDHGYEVVIFNDSTLALAYLNEQIEQVGMLITDLRMPRLDGMELARRVKAQREDLPVLMITGYAQSTTASDREHAGIEGCLSKPFRIEQLLQSIVTHAPKSA